MGLISKIFGSRNEREVKKMRPLVDRIGSFEGGLEDKTDAEIQAYTGEFKQRLANGASLDDILPEAFAVVREAGKRVLGMRHYDVQLIGGMVLHKGRIAEMRTGEGKTLVGTLPVYLNALEGKGVHVVTVNDYLASRDAEWMGQLYNWMGMEVGVIVHGLSDIERQQQYNRDITYGQNSEFGFDYLRDNMKMSPDRMVQRELHYAVVDEVDSILIDEARTPLIISGPAERKAGLYRECDKIVPRLKRDIDYTVDEKAHSTMLTDSGVEKVQELLNLSNLYDPENIEWVHHVGNALKAHTLYKRDDKYLVEDGKVVIVDEFTGRKMPGRRWSDGLHQAIEAKENVHIEEENQTLATITYQNFFRMYDKLGGMTGTADTEAAEFHHIYKLEVTVIPTNKPVIRDDQPDLVYKNEKGKIRAVLDDIMDCYSRGQPVLVGTTSVEKSEVIANFLRSKKVPFEVLNAKQHGREAAVVAQAGRKGALTISTNMAGRGTDILLGGNPEFLTRKELAEKYEEDAPGEGDPEYDELLAKYREQCKGEREEVLSAGGLKIIGTERHESRRIDNQLRGRAGRQGDPGASRFYLSLEDDLMRIFGADRISGIMERLGMEEDVPIEHSWVTKAVENAQKKVEGSNFDSRKNVLEYDDVMNQQRRTIYTLRRQILRGEYRPTLTEEEEKAGQVAEPPSTSGSWTIDGLKDEVRASMAEAVTSWKEHSTLQAELEAAQAAAAEQSPVEGEDDFEEDGDFSETPPSDQPAWRLLRHDVWRQTGAWCADLNQEMFEGSEEDLVDYISETVARSQIQQRERVLDLADIVLGQLMDTHCPPTTHDDEWDIENLEKGVREHFALEIDIPRQGLEREELVDQLWEAIAGQIDEREKDLTRPWFMYFSRHFYLEEIDKQWIDNLTVMDHLRQGIGLRGYGQKDPKKEYKKEGYDLFAAMMENIQQNVCRNIFRVQIKREEEQIPELQAKEREMHAHHQSASTSGSDDSSVFGDAADGGKSAAPSKPQTVRRQAPKVGRNDPCPCGSGKKYKKCHGRSDAEAQM